MAKLLLLLLLFLTACGGRTYTAPSSVTEDPNLPPTARLGNASTPIAARLHIEIDPDRATFVGHIHIEVDLQQPLHTFWLHQKQLNLLEVSFERDGSRTKLSIFKTKNNEELVGLRAPAELQAGSGTLHIDYRGQLGNRQGLFRQQEDDRFYAYTDFEATDARAAFPFYDDPRFKIPWTVELTVPKGNLAFSNTPEVSRITRTLSATREATVFRFAQTRPLPSYLVAFAVGPFDVLQGESPGVPLRIIAPKGQAQKGRFVLAHMATWIHFFERYLATPMPYAKLDFIAVPRFSGAMENPGLVTFTSSILLIGDNATELEKRRAAGVSTHEIAHLWFGDSLTPNYWNDLWLSEGLVTWLADKAMAAWQPAKAREVNPVADKSAAYPFDHSLVGRRVQTPVADHNDLRKAFGAITYRKGGALFTMLESWMGAVAMQTLIRRYLQAHTDSTVQASDFLAAIQAVTQSKSTYDLFLGYLQQPGIPMVALTLRCNRSTAQVTLSQKRYLPRSVNRASGAASKAATQRWHIPVCMRYPTPKGPRSQCTLLASASKTIDLQSAVCPSWIAPNRRESGYYHYQMSATQFAALREGGKLDPRESLGLLHSIVANLKSADLSLGESMKLLHSFASDLRPQVQEVLITLLYELSRSVVEPSMRPAFAAMIRDWYRPVVASLSIHPRPGETEDLVSLRPALLTLLADLGEDKALQARVTTATTNWLLAPSKQDYALLNAWLLIAAFNGDGALQTDYQHLQASTPNPLVATLLSGAQLAFTHPPLFRKGLAQALRIKLRGPTVFPTLALSLRHPELRAITLRSIRENRISFLNSTDKKRRFETLGHMLSSLCSLQAEQAITALAHGAFATATFRETIASCTRQSAALQAGARAFFSSSKPATAL